MGLLTKSLVVVWVLLIVQMQMDVTLSEGLPIESEDGELNFLTKLRSVTVYQVSISRKVCLSYFEQLRGVIPVDKSLLIIESSLNSR